MHPYHRHGYIMVANESVGVITHQRANFKSLWVFQLEVRSRVPNYSNTINLLLN